MGYQAGWFWNSQNRVKWGFAGWRIRNCRIRTLYLTRNGRRNKRVLLLKWPLGFWSYHLLNVCWISTFQRKNLGWNIWTHQKRHIWNVRNNPSTSQRLDLKVIDYKSRLKTWSQWYKWIDITSILLWYWYWF